MKYCKLGRLPLLAIFYQIQEVPLEWYTVMGFTQVGSMLACKYQTRVDICDSKSTTDENNEELKTTL